MTTSIYRNPRAWRVRVAQAAIWACAVFVVWICLFAPVNPNDGPADRIVMLAAPVFVLACVAGFECYLRLYVVLIAQEADHIAVTTLATLHRRTLLLDKKRLRLGGQRHDRILPGLSPGVDNFSSRLRVTGWRLPLIVDETPPARLDRAALEKALR